MLEDHNTLLQSHERREELTVQIYQRFLEKLAASEKRYRELVEGLGVVIFRCDQKGDITFLNRAWTDILGHSVEECLGQRISDFVLFEDRKKWHTLLSGQNASNTRDDEQELRFCRKDGASVWFQVSLHSDADATIIGSLYNVDNRKRIEEENRRLEAQLQRAQKLEAIGTLAGGIAHDFNNLLTAIYGHLSLLLFPLTQSHPHYERLKALEKLVQSAAKLTRQILGYARQGKYEVKPVEFNQLVEEISDTFGRTHREISIHLDLAKDLFVIEADSGQMEQVLLNLFVNAADAMPGGGELILSTSNVKADDMGGRIYNPKSGDYILLTVTDTGIGMDEDTMQRIFDPFFTTKERGQGTGLGLACAYGILKNHGGYIDVQSKKGCGTTFLVYLPRSQKRVGEVSNDSHVLIKGTGTILLVDDEPEVRETGRELLEVLGFQVLMTADGESAVEAFRKHPGGIDLIILDVIMPGMSGGEAYRRIKEIDPGAKVLFCSGYSRDSEIIELLTHSAVNFIQKPFTFATLSSSIDQVLKQAA